MVIEVEIRQPSASAIRVLRFSKSPVRLGRNELNDIPLDDPFVSEWHGIIRADENQVAYFDLGSTNGTSLGGKRLAKNVPVLLDEMTRLNIGTLVISVVAFHDQPSPPVKDPPQRQGSGLHRTLGWGSATPGSQGGPDRSISRPYDSSLPDPIGVSPNISGGPPFDPPWASPPQYGVTPPVAIGRANASQRPPARPNHPTSPVPDPLVARHGRLLEAFSEAFVGLRKGYEQLGADVGVRTVNGTTPLHRARSAREVVDYLMLPSVDPDAAARDLIAIFADFGIHHIALMEGITESMRAVLRSVDPRTNKLDPGDRRWSASKFKTQWLSYLERFDELVTDDESLHGALFGDAFARAYASVATGEERPKGKDK